MLLSVALPALLIPLAAPSLSQVFAAFLSLLPKQWHHIRPRHLWLAFFLYYLSCMILFNSIEKRYVHDATQISLPFKCTVHQNMEQYSLLSVFHSKVGTYKVETFDFLFNLIASLLASI